MIILDTNVVSELMKPAGDSVVVKWLDEQVAESLFLTATSLSELLLGIELLPPGKRRQDLLAVLEGIVEQILDSRVLPFDEPAARAYSTILARARRQGRAISILDGQIAAIAESHGYSVATRDTSPFEAAGVAFVNPWEL
jgi:predicted nucleic acid-binding protein